MSDDGSGGVIKSHDDVVGDCWFMDEKGEMKTEFNPTPAGVDFSKKKKTKTNEQQTNQCHLFLISFPHSTRPSSTLV